MTWRGRFVPTAGSRKSFSLTGYAQPEYIERVAAAGIDRHPAKQVEMETLQRMLVVKSKSRKSRIESRKHKGQGSMSQRRTLVRMPMKTAALYRLAEPVFLFPPFKPHQGLIQLIRGVCAASTVGL